MIRVVPGLVGFGRSFPTMTLGLLFGSLDCAETTPATATAINTRGTNFACFIADLVSRIDQTAPALLAVANAAGQSACRRTGTGRGTAFERVSGTTREAVCSGS